MPISIALTDDHPMVLEGISKLLQPFDHIKIEALYRSGKELLMGLMISQPDVLIIDINLPDIPGNDLTKMVSKKYPTSRIIILSSIDTPFYVNEVMKYNCYAYLTKNSGLNTLLSAIEAAYHGEKYLDDSIKEAILNSATLRKKEICLTKREKEILTLVCEGDTNKEIAEKLFVNIRTVENHRFSLYAKFQVKNVAGLVKIALQTGLIT